MKRSVATLIDTVRLTCGLRATDGGDHVQVPVIVPLTSAGTAPTAQRQDHFSVRQCRVDAGGMIERQLESGSRVAQIP
jgi:hypothetical protein